MSATPYSLGRLPYAPDHRDFPARAFLPAQATAPGMLPDNYRLLGEGPIYDQGQTSMCVDFLARQLKERQEWKERGVFTPMANGYVYGNRAPGDYEGEGMFIREALKCLAKCGQPPASAFSVVGTYEECRAAYLAHQPDVDKAALPQRIMKYVLCASVAEAMAAIYHLQSPVAVGITVTTAFMFVTSRDGRVPMEPPENFREGGPSVQGGHGVIADGWETIDGYRWLTGPNSWGTGWGDGGRWYMREDYPGIDELWAVTDARPRGRRLRFELGSQVLTAIWPQPDGSEQTKTFTMDVAPFLQNNRTWLPPRFVADGISLLLTAGGPAGGPLIPLPISDETGKLLAVELVLPDPAP